MPRYCMCCVVTPKLISLIADVALVLPTHANNHITPKDD